MNIWKILPAVALLTLPFVARADDTNSVAATNAISPFDQAVADFQASPTDATLEIVIKQAATLDKLPPTPEEARRHFVRGEALFQDATNNPEGFAPAIKEFAEAVKLAPWVRNIRYNLARACEANNDYAATITQYRRYLLFKLPDDEARAVQDKIYALEVKAETANKKKTEEQAAAAAEQRAADEVLAKQRQTKEVIAKLKAIVGGAYYDRKAANYKNPFTSEGGPIAGVNEAEKQGKCWYNWGKSCEKYIFEDERVLICFVSDQGVVNQEHPDLIGTPNGSSLQDIVWVNGGNNKKVWFSFDDENGDITWSHDRPLNDSEFDPNTRYSYMWYKRSN